MHALQVERLSEDLSGVRLAEIATPMQFASVASDSLSPV